MGILKLENVGYRYKDAPKDSFVFKNINYEFEEGKMYAIKGKSGSGKTTLLSLITGLEKCTEGQILYDGKTLNNKEDLTAFLKIKFDKFQVQEQWDELTEYIKHIDKGDELSKEVATVTTAEKNLKANGTADDYKKL